MAGHQAGQAGSDRNSSARSRRGTNADDGGLEVRHPSRRQRLDHQARRADALSTLRFAELRGRKHPAGPWLNVITGAGDPSAQHRPPPDVRRSRSRRSAKGRESRRRGRNAESAFTSSSAARAGASYRRADPAQVAEAIKVDGYGIGPGPNRRLPRDGRPPITTSGGGARPFSGVSERRDGRRDEVEMGGDIEGPQDRSRLLDGLRRPGAPRGGGTNGDRGFLRQPYRRHRRSNRRTRSSEVFGRS